MSSPPEAIWLKKALKIWSRNSRGIAFAYIYIYIWVSSWSSNKNKVVSFPFIPYNLCPINQAVGSPLEGLETGFETYRKSFNKKLWDVGSCYQKTYSDGWFQRTWKPRKLFVLHNFTRKHEGFLAIFTWSQSWMIIPMLSTARLRHFDA